MLQKIGSKETTGGGQAGTANIATDLQPIIEHVQMNFISPTHIPKAISTSDNVKENNEEIVTSSTSMSSYSISDSFLRTILNTNSEDTNLLTIISETSLEAQNLTSMSNTTQPSINFHEMNRTQLAAQLRALKLTKRNLRSVLRTFENDFYKKTGKRVEKEDRCNMSTVYYVYKVQNFQFHILMSIILFRFYLFYFILF